MHDRTIRRYTPRNASTEQDVSGDELLERQARANERKLAYLRVASAIAFALLSVGSWNFPGLVGLVIYPLTELLWIATWVGAAVGLAVALRQGWFPVWLPWLVPAADALVLWLAATRFRTAPVYAGDPVQHPGVVGTLAVLAALLVFSGAFRLRRGSALLTTFLAVAVFGSVAIAIGLHTAHTASVLIVLVVIGLLGMDAEQGFRRTLRGEVGRRQTERRLRETEMLATAARQAADAREEILRVVAHDLRNPLGAVAMSADILLEDFGGSLNHPAPRKYLEIIRRAAAGMERLIQDLFDVTRIEAGSLAVELEDADVAGLVREALETLEPLAAKRSIQLVLATTGELPRTRLDPGRIHQVLSNLIGNALKFTPEGGRVAVCVDREDAGLRVGVLDTGEGIAADQLPRIFQPFWQVHAADRRGLGLGLAITRGIVEAHGGRIWAESEPGNGSAFYFTLPVTASEPFERRGTGAPLPSHAIRQTGFTQDSRWNDFRSARTP